jgi:xanthine dehydrogenase YagS FAD-binding subunit
VGFWRFSSKTRQPPPGNLNPMNLFSYTRVQNAAAATDAATHNPQASFLAGGTTLIDLMKLNVEKPTQLIDINRLPLNQIVVKDGVRIEANVRNSDLAHDARIISMFPVLSEALLSGASPQLRNMATLGGNLLQRTRCYYFRDGTSPCNKREPGTGCSAIGGYNRIHAVLGTSEKCIATHPSDMCVALAALDATIITNQRSIPFNDFYIAYGDDPARETTLNHGELITAVEIPPTPFFAKSHYLKVRDRASYEFALASAAVALDIDGGKIKQARVALGGVASKPWRSIAAEKALVGAPAADGTYAKAAEAALADAKPQSFNAFKIELAKRTIVAALSTVAAMV